MFGLAIADPIDTGAIELCAQPMCADNSRHVTAVEKINHLDRYLAA
jgi:hypothetical protein